MNSNRNDIEKLKMKIAIFNTKEDIKNKYLQKINEKKGVKLMRKKIIATACASLVLASGIVVAANIENIKTHFRGLGDGVDTAVENGYIATPNAEKADRNTIGVDTESTIENINTKITIEDFLMDDVNLSTQILFEFDDKIKSVINLDKVINIELTDLIVRDEENRILYGGNDEERFKAYCEENNLNYTFCEFNKNYMNCGVNSFDVMKDKENNSIKIMYNMYTSDTYPKSKKLYFSFKTIMFNELVMSDEKKYELKGNWEIVVDVPENMHTRTSESYKVIHCNNSDFQIYSAKATDTGFEIGAIISNIKEPKWDNQKMEEFEQLLNDYHNNKISYNEYLEKSMWYYETLDSCIPISVLNYNHKGETVEASYIENESGDRFYSNLAPSRKAKTYFLNGDKYDFYETFSMTKYNATDKIKVVLYYYGEPVTIELEKVK